METQKMRNYEAKPNYRHIAVLIVAVTQKWKLKKCATTKPNPITGTSRF